MRILSSLSNLKAKITFPCLFGIAILLQLNFALPVTSIIIFAQTPPLMSTPTSPTSSTSSVVNSTTPIIEITSHQDDQRVPVGELTIEGTSSDNEESNCQVYADVNDITPMQNATAAGLGGANDYSNWTFVYSPDYQAIAEGINELTVKISCFDVGPTSISKFNSVNITGLPSPDTFAAPVPIPSTTG